VAEVRTEARRRGIGRRIGGMGICPGVTCVSCPLMPRRLRTHQGGWCIHCVRREGEGHRLDRYRVYMLHVHVRMCMYYSEYIATQPLNRAFLNCSDTFT